MSDTQQTDPAGHGSRQAARSCQPPALAAGGAEARRSAAAAKALAAGPQQAGRLLQFPDDRCLSFGALGLFAAFYFGKLRFEEPGPLQAGADRRRQGRLQPCAHRRAARGEPASSTMKWLFRIGVRGYGAAGDLKPGEYAFTPGHEHVRRDGSRSAPARASSTRSPFPEGLTSYQIVERLKRGSDPDRRPADRKSRRKARCCRTPTHTSAARRGPRFSI